MKVVITGSLGHIGRPLTQLLVSNKHEVTVITSKFERLAEIEALGAKAAVGSVTNTNFLTHTFTGADAVYTMMPPATNYFDPSFDMMAYAETLRTSYFEAISKTSVKHVVNLSSWGAHLSSGTGGIVTTYHMEQQLNQLPEEVSIVHIRPTSFYYNMLGFIPMIKHQGRITLNYGADDVVALVASADIAAAVAEELENAAQGCKVRYIASDELTCHEIASILGDAIGMPNLQWIRITGQEAKSNLEAAGLSSAVAASVAEIQGAIHKGLLAEDYQHHKPTVFGKIKTADFAKEFAAVYNSK